MNSFLVIQVPLKKKSKKKQLNSNGQSVGDILFSLQDILSQDEKSVEDPIILENAEKNAAIMEGIVECLRVLKKLEELSPQSQDSLALLETSRLLNLPPRGSA